MAEEAFIRNFLSTISGQPVQYGNDYCQPPANSLPRVPVLQVPVPPPPARKHTAARDDKPFTVHIKCTKPPLSFTLSVSGTDSVAHLKSLLPSIPADVQRLVLKGKVLSDAKLLREYTIRDGDTVNLMLKAGYTPPTNTDTTNTDNKPADPMEKPALSLASPTPAAPTGGKKHSRIPSVVLSPSPSSETMPGSKSADVLLNLDIEGRSSPSAEDTSYRAVVSNPEFWEKLVAFLKSEFPQESDAFAAFEDFLRAVKGSLTASEIAKIRDSVGIVGMAGK